MLDYQRIKYIDFRGMPNFRTVLQSSPSEGYVCFFARVSAIAPPKQTPKSVKPGCETMIFTYIFTSHFPHMSEDVGTFSRPVGASPIHSSLEVWSPFCRPPGATGRAAWMWPSTSPEWRRTMGPWGKETLGRFGRREDGRWWEGGMLRLGVGEPKKISWMAWKCP